MKKFITVLLVLVMIFSLCSCGESKSEANTGTEGSVDSPSEGAQQAEEVENDTIEVDEGLIFVEITVPNTFLEGETEESIKASAVENGFSDCVIHEDGSVTYKMTKAKHREFMAEAKASFEATIEDLISGEGAVASFLKIEYSDDFSKFDVYVDPALYSDWDSFYVLVFYMTGGYYQIFDGKSIDEIDVLVNFINNDTNEIINSGSFRDWSASAEAAN